MRTDGIALKGDLADYSSESHILPPELEQVLARVQNAADYMPEWQTSVRRSFSALACMISDVAIQKVMSSELGHDWRQKFGSFDLVPFAAASIGQVHAATLPDGTDVAVKVQFPGVANSIDADIGNIRFLLSFSALLPRGLYLENTLKTMRTELAQECDYEYEAASARTYKTLLGSLPQFAAPKIVDTLSTRQVLTMEMMHGVPVTKLLDHPQDLRDRVSTCSFSLFSRGAGL